MHFLVYLTLHELKSYSCCIRFKALFAPSVSLNRSIHHIMSSQFSAFEWASGEAQEEGWGKEGVHTHTRTHSHSRTALPCSRRVAGFLSSHHSVSHLAVFHTRAKDQEEREKVTVDCRRRTEGEGNSTSTSPFQDERGEWVKHGGCQCSRRISDCR